jgi:hypothetical protein
MGLLGAALCLLVLATGGQEPPKQPAHAQDWQSFEGNLSAAGTRQTLPMGSGRNAGIVYLSGSLVMTSQEGLSRGFRCEVVAYENEAGLSVGSCVWTDDRGHKVFSEIRGDSVEKGKRITGTITGGTGRYAGLAGEYDFVWEYVVSDQDGAIQGRAVGLKGRVHRVAPGAAVGRVKP